jgi:CelD/BcsL family acetyltransferase involved in cellulose biosynthesis
VAGLRLRSGEPAEKSAPGAPPSLTRLELDDPRWHAFVASSPDATPFHHPAWAGLLAETYRYRGFGLALRDDDGLVLAGAPLIAVKRLGHRGRRWISLPFTDECPVVARDRIAERAFLEALNGAGERLEIRARVDAVGWATRAEAVVHELALDADPERVRERFNRSQVVRNIRRAEREGVTVRAATSTADLDSFYALHARTRRRQGVPVQPRRFFDLLWDRMIEPGLGSILLAYRDSTPLAGALFLTWNATTIYKFGASDPEGWPARPNHALFWAAIEASCLRGDRRFDFGRTDLGHVGLQAFKSGWGASARPLVYSSLDPGILAGTDGLAGRAMAAAIRRGPEWLCRTLGETLYRYAASR